MIVYLILDILKYELLDSRTLTFESWDVLQDVTSEWTHPVEYVTLKNE